MKKLILWFVNSIIPNIANISLLPIVLIITLLSGCDQQQKQILEEGLLTGKITIGPLCPVETVPPDPNCQPTEETYKAWPIAVWSADKKAKIGRIQPDLDGIYNFVLLEGSYFVDLENQHFFGTTLPTTVKIGPDETVVLNIDIDTGIR